VEAVLDCFKIQFWYLCCRTSENHEKPVTAAGAEPKQNGNHYIVKSWGRVVCCEWSVWERCDSPNTNHITPKPVCDPLTKARPV